MLLEKVCVRVRLSLFQYPVHLRRSFSSGYSSSLGPVVFLGAKRAHCQVKLCTDASSFAWGCVFGPDTLAAVIRDFWPVDQHHLNINVKEALALANALDAFSSSFCDSWVDVYTDSQVVIGSWRYQGSKSRDLADDFKRIFGIVSTYNIHLNLFYISSADNPADTPSRVFPLQDSKHSPSAWVQVLWMVPPFLSFPHISFLSCICNRAFVILR